ncbi:MAG: 50S ribosomal protein L18e [Nanoarchaeota archaeon]|nr:50S ribosomal protein L18e [Nanoarchaeota archaeon]MBU1051452.1 50S ribosomal protein L18e [Nanoarchaeota archaeon]MBU1989011.1 50S ribosomal protein L18e [Nanoarchaeota archaeon]
MHKLSKTKLKSRTKKKTNPVLVETLNAAIKNPSWKEVSKLLSTPTRRYSSVNLFEIDKQTKAGDTVIIPGKVLSKGEMTKKVRICALSISEKAKEKLKPTKSEIVSILEEITKNKKAEGIKIIK